MNLELNQVYTFKLNSGEELVAKVVKINEKTLELNDPLVVAPNHQGMGLLPGMFTADHDKTVELNTNSITMYAPTSDSIVSKYLEATTGIATPSKKLILG